jgi:hypothetical protein
VWRAIPIALLLALLLLGPLHGRAGRQERISSALAAGLDRGEPPLPGLLLSPALLVAPADARGPNLTIQRAGYAAVLDATGMLASLRIGEAEVLRGPLEFCPGVRWILEKQERSPNGSEFRFTLRTGPASGGPASGRPGAGEIVCRFEDQRLSVTLLHHTSGFQSWQLGLGDQVLAVEDLQNRAVTGAEAIQYVDRGEIRPLPAVRLARVQRARLHLRSGATLLFWHDGWGAPFNLDEIGSFSGFNYRRNLLEADHPMRLSFAVEANPARRWQPAPAFVPTPAVAASLFYAGEAVRFTLRATEATRERLQAARRWRVTWSVRDFWDRPAGSGVARFDGAALGGPGGHPGAPVAIPLRQRGWFSVLFTLSPDEKVDPPVLPSEFRTRFAVVDRRAPLPPRPSLSEPLSQYGYSALIGLKCVRESDEMRRFFPQRGRADWKALDTLFDRAAKEARRWGETWFFQANERPAWCSEQDYEQITFDLVSRYKDRCRTWEVENEPNFRMPAARYVRDCLVPFAKGAKRGDPGCQVLGPACVSVPHSLAFMQAIVATDARQYLDGVSTHSYVGPGEPWELYGNALYLQHLRLLTEGKPLWQTEQGYAWDHVSKQQHARYVVRQFLNGLAAGIAPERHFYYYSVHNGFEPWYLVESGSSEGLNGTLEPAAVALRVMNEELAGRALKETTQPAFGITSLRFSGAKDDLIALWTLDFPATVSVRGRILGATDCMGKPRPLPRRGGGFSLSVDGYPTYLRVPRGEPLRVTGPDYGTNLARGAAAQASSATKDHPAAHAIDGSWSPRDPAPGIAPRTYWEAAAEGASESQPAWLELTFAAPHTVSRAMLLTPLPAIDATPRDFALQVGGDGQPWQTVAEVKGAASWATMLNFKPVKARKVRLLITGLNDGWHLDGRWRSMVREDFARYTDLHAKVLELMFFGTAGEGRGQG